MEPRELSVADGDSRGRAGVCAFAAVLVFAMGGFPWCAPIALAQDKEPQAGSEADRAPAVSDLTRQQVIDAGKWHVKAGRFLYRDARGKRVRGLVKIGGKSYYFDKKGIQRTGWQKISGKYRFFRIANKSAGSLVKDEVVNGIRLGPNGVASYGKQGRAELSLMITANGVYQKIARPAWNQRKRLNACFNWIWRTCRETSSHGFRNVSGWPRSYARDMFKLRHGSCFVHAAAFAYLANACGAKQVAVVTSGGHAWAEVNHKVTDIEWSRHVPQRIFMYPRNKRKKGLPRYNGKGLYVSAITRSKPWDRTRAHR